MPETLIRLFEMPSQPGTCRGCEAKIVWYTTLTGKKMPMNAGARPEKTEVDAKTKRTVGYYRSSESHFVTCPDRAKFSKKKKARR